MDYWVPRLLPYIVTFVVGGSIQLVSGSPLFSVVAGIATWLCCAGYVPNPIAYFEKLARERRGIPELKFKRGDRVRFSNATEVQYGIVSEISPKREMFAIAWDYSGSRRWHAVFDQDLFDIVTPAPN